jgi:putative oxidoreductase
MAFLGGLTKYSSFGLLILRIGLGIMMIFHGYPKLAGGPEKWEKLGGSLSNFGIEVYPVVFGLLAALAEALGGVLIVLGLAFRAACFFLLITMIVAATNHLMKGDPFMSASHAIELGFVFFGLFFVGPGRFSVDKV